MREWCRMLGLPTGAQVVASVRLDDEGYEKLEVATRTEDGILGVVNIGFKGTEEEREAAAYAALDKFDQDTAQLAFDTIRNALKDA